MTAVTPANAFRPSKIFVSEQLQAVVDAAMEAKQQAEPPRDYLGGSRLGHHCLRALAYEFTKTPKDEGKHFKGKTLRIFDMGHDGEERMASYLRLSGFQLVTHRPDGKQLGFYVAKIRDPDTGEERSRISGHLDGVIVGAPPSLAELIKAPALWENKMLGAKSWKEMARDGVERSKPVYFVQMQTYMAYMDLGDNPGLFTATNRDTGEIHAELVPYNPAVAQEASDKGIKVVLAADPRELPRCTTDPQDYRCTYCDFAARCWDPTQPPDAMVGPGGFAALKPPVANPAWLAQAGMPKPV